jgi:hypothetical protein
MSRADRPRQHIEDLAAFLDLMAFEHRHDFSLAKRREAAWRKAANRIGLPQPKASSL